MKQCRKAVIYGLLFMMVLGLILLLIGWDHSLETVTYPIKRPELSGRRIALVCDLHSCDYGEQGRELLDAIDEQAPDLVLLGGDIVDDVLPQAGAEVVLDYLGAHYPTYYVSGNHEYWSGRIDQIKQMIQDKAITVLEGDSQLIKLGDATIRLSGIDDPEVGESEMIEQFLAVSDITGPEYHILLAHRPELIYRYLSGDFDLILSGHAHGGQWRIPYLLNGLIAPNQGLFPKYAGGRYDFEVRTMIVSRGLARETTIVPRLFNPPELVIIEFE
ncbi:MAG TPA: metallophosphoesterase [Tissierellia bacterium]|nr:metallophosphoesterase [Tissierellia bacterium]